MSLADLHRLRDILHVTDDVHGRCVVFLQNQYQPSKVHQFSGEQSTRDVISVSRSSSSISEVWYFRVLLDVLCYQLLDSTERYS